MELQKQLVDYGKVELIPAFAQLPSVTPVGMASLLPGAGSDLVLGKKANKVQPRLGDSILTNVNQRLNVLRQRYGQRFTDVKLNEFARKQPDIPETTELLLIRSNEMDNDFETNPEAAPSLISRTFQQVRAALFKLTEMGFQDALIVTDHGFYLNTAIEPGDECAKPPGTWLCVHDRLLLGDGASDANNFVMAASTLGIRGDFNQVAGPRAMVAYRSGQTYFHGGASFQETIVPVISVRLSESEEPVSKQPTITLKYKRGAKRITTLRPVVEITADPGDLFSMGSTIEILLEAQDSAGRVVGEAQPGDAVNPATMLVAIKPGETIQVTLKMDQEFEGHFTLKAQDPETLTTFAKLNLKTDYMV